MMRTQIQIPAEEGETPDPLKEKEEKEGAPKGADVAGQQAPPSHRKGEADRELWIQPNRQERGRVVRVESRTDGILRRERVRSPMSLDGKAALRTKPENSHTRPAVRKQSVRSQTSRLWTSTGGEKESTWSGSMASGSNSQPESHIGLWHWKLCTTNRWRST